MVDLSKAFDRINKNILFKKLYETGLNPKFVEILRCMYDEAYVHTSFNKINPLRPRGHICPALFECNFQCLFLIYVNILHVFHRDKTFKYP